MASMSEDKHKERHGLLHIKKMHRKLKVPVIRPLG